MNSYSVWLYWCLGSKGCELKLLWTWLLAELVISWVFSDCINKKCIWATLTLFKLNSLRTSLRFKKKKKKNSPLVGCVEFSGGVPAHILGILQQWEFLLLCCLDSTAEESAQLAQPCFWKVRLELLGSGVSPSPGNTGALGQWPPENRRWDAAWLDSPEDTWKRIISLVSSGWAS